MAETTKVDSGRDVATKKDRTVRLILTVPRLLVPGGKEHAAGTPIAEIRILADGTPSAIDKAIQARAVRVAL